METVRFDSNFKKKLVDSKIWVTQKFEISGQVESGRSKVKVDGP